MSVRDLSVPYIRLLYIDGKWRLCGRNKQPLLHTHNHKPIDSGGHLFKAKAKRQMFHVQQWYERE